MNGIDPLTLENRRTIYKLITNYPGIHLGQLHRKSYMSQGTIRYHIRYLKSRNMISVKKEKGYIRFYSTKNIGSNHKDLLSMIRVETLRNILLFMLVSPCTSQNTISKELEKHPTTIKYFLKKLEEKEIIEKVQVKDKIAHTNLKRVKNAYFPIIGREIAYKLKDPYLVYDTLVFYQDKLFDRGISKKLLEFCDTAGKFFSSEDIIPDYYGCLDRVADKINDIFPQFLR